MVVVFYIVFANDDKRKLLEMGGILCLGLNFVYCVLWGNEWIMYVTQNCIAKS